MVWSPPSGWLVGEEVAEGLLLMVRLKSPPTDLRERLLRRRGCLLGIGSQVNIGAARRKGRTWSLNRSSR